MRITILLSLFCLGIGITCRGGNTNAPVGKIEIEIGEHSPNGDFYIEHRLLPPGEVKQIWLVSSKNPQDRRLLYTHSRSAAVFFSDDEHWLAVTDYAGSDLAEVIIFRQQKGIDYRKVEDITDRAWSFLGAKMGRKKRPELDHSYAEAMRWTDDQTLLVCLHGYFSGTHNDIEDWLCFYDVKTRTFSTDLDSHNRRHATLEPGPTPAADPVKDTTQKQ
jgi:hypothetical protein